MPKSRRYYFLAFPILLLLVTAGVAADILFPYRPTSEEAAQKVLERLRGEYSFQQFKLHNTNVNITSMHPLAKTQIVTVTSTQIADDKSGNPTQTANMYAIDFVTRHWLTGARIIASTGGYYPRKPEDMVSPIVMFSTRQEGAYVAGGVVVDRTIASVKGAWLDGSETIAHITKDTFLFVRSDGVSLAWVIGLDAQGQPIGTSITYDPNVDFTPLDYSATRQVVVEGGVIIMGAYLQSSPNSQECIELTYLTVENARRYLAGGTAFTGQQACVSPTSSSSLAPSVSTVITDQVTIAGYVSNQAIHSVLIGWSDGFSQTVPVIDGFYFSQRPEPSVAVASLMGLDAEGEVISP